MLNNQFEDSEQSNEEQSHDRGIPSVNERTSGKKKRIIAILLITLVLLGGAAAYFKYRVASHKAAQKPKEPESKPSSVPRKTFEFLPEALQPVAEAIPVADSTIVPPVKPIPVKDPMETKPLAEDFPQQEDKVVEIPVDPRLSSPIFSDDESNSSSGPAVKDENFRTVAATTKATKTDFDDEDGDTGPLNDQLKPTVTQAKSAAYAPKQDYLLAKGTMFPCNMETLLDSTVAGMVRCRVAKNVYSANGRVLLMEKGSEATGEYQSNVKQGQARLYVLWNSIRTPNGVEVPLDSPSSDQLGGMGMPGYVDTHFWERFGGAMMISIAGDALSILRSQGNTSGSPVVMNNTSGQANQMSQEALRNTINIPPTIYNNQGERIQIYVARNVSFESVYHVK